MSGWKPQNTTTQQKQIFVSYSRSDRIAVDKLVGTLRSRYYILWLDVDEQGIEPGEDWHRELVEQMSASEAVIACISPDFLTSPYCQEEITQAKNENKLIYPVLVRRLDKRQSLDDISLSHLQYVDLTQNWNDGLKRLSLVLPRPKFPRGMVLQRIGLTVVAALAMIALAVVVALASGLGASILGNVTTPTPIIIPSLRSFDVGIVVAYFAIPDDNSVAQDEADALVEQVFTRLQSELVDFSEQTGTLVGFLEPGIVGRIKGTTRAEREENARDLARRHDADIVLYGQITRSPRGNLEVLPEFYVLPETFSDALEITGSFRLGKGIEVEGPLAAIRNAMNVNRPLSARTTAAAQIFSGLTYYGLEQYDRALTAFQAASDLPSWDETDGREVLYVLLGNTRVRLAAVAAQNGDTETADDELQVAINEYEQAKTLAPDYARLYTGLASAHYLLWNLSAQKNTLDRKLLEQALSYQDSARTAADTSQDIGVQTKELFVRLQVNYALWTYHLQDFSDSELNDIYDDFTKTADQIIRRYDDGNNPSVQELASETYMLRGLTAYSDNDCDVALADYQQGLDLSLSSRRRIFFYGYMAQCYSELKQSDKAIEAYQEALKLAEENGNVSNDLIASYQAQLDEIWAKP